jgi:protein-L-isoaspartate(D-aspartate) O-methyltransferase
MMSGEDVPGEAPRSPPRPDEAELSRLRREMVEQQIVARGISDQRLLAAMLEVPRHHFVPARSAALAYRDGPLPIGHGQTISQPYMVAIMTELLGLTGGERVLEVGTGSGYQTAILARLAREVVTVERLEDLTLQACESLSSLGFRNVNYHVGDGSVGYRHRAPYDRILVTAGAPAVPAALVNQLAEGGVLVAPVGSRFEQVLVRLRKEGGALREDRLTECVFVPLVGQQGWDSADEDR